MALQNQEKNKPVNLLTDQIATLFPGYFALVMATGIISIAAHLLGMPFIASALFWCNLIFYGVLAIAFILRLIFYFRRVVQDIVDHQNGPGFFTLVAGSCILGVQLVVLNDLTVIPQILLAIATVLWFIIIYAFFTAITVKEEKPRIEKGINGSWLIIVVATQSVAILTTFLAEGFESHDNMLLFALCMYLIGCILYILINGMIVYRFSFFMFKPTELGAPYWINTGATAITTLAGSTLMLNAGNWWFLQDILPFLKGFTLFFWSAGAWWIPLFIILGVWRHIVKKVPFPYHKTGYHPSYWSMVFPLGMFTVCTYRLSEALGLSALMIIPEYFIYLAFLFWAMVFSGLAHQLYGKLRTLV